jgi:serine/threonine protein kinase
MSSLESRGGLREHEEVPQPSLDFLQPSEQSGILGRFGPYEVIAHIASGGMGIVLKARDPALNRIVALKILPPALAANSLARSRFVREARAAAAVVHDHVVPIYAVNECRGLPYLVMQFVEGRSLAERIRLTGPLQLEEILRIGAQTAAGLAAAHAQGLIHRDVKPGNILLENSVERVKLTDFGLARAVDDAGLTRTGELAGTPEFMAPEQAGNGPLDHRSDLFSLGSVLHAMCTGCSPFHGNSVVAVIRKVCDEHPTPVHEINSTIPRWLSDIIARLMAKVPEERFQSAREVSELLERYLARVQRGELGPLGEISKPRWAVPQLRWRLLGGAAVGLGIIASLVLTFKEPRKPTFSSSPPTSAKERVELTSKPPGQEPFLVRTETGANVGAFAVLQDALTAAPTGGVVELRWNGAREMPPTRLQAKPITLRAAKGFRPAWIHTDLSVSAISASAALSVEDIELSLRPDATAAPGRPRPRPRMTRSGVGLIAISNAPLRLSRSVLQLPDPRLQARGGQLGAAGLTAIILDNVATCDLENSALLGDPWTAILWRQTARATTTLTNGESEIRLSLSNCVVTAFRAFWIELPEDSRARLQLVRNTFRGLHLIQFPATAAGRAITVIARTNLFSMGAMLTDDRGTEREVLTASMRWQGSENLFNPSSPSGGRWSWGYIVLGNRAGPTTLAQWNQWWPEPETGSREATVTFAGGGNMPASASRADFVRAAYKVDRMTFNEGPPLAPDQWSHFGADINNVGPRSVK